MNLLRLATSQQAFLNASFTSDDEDIYLKVGKDLVSFWGQLDSTIEDYINNNGDVFMKLDKYIHGLKQSPANFQRHLTKTLIAGYTQLINDDCLFMKKDDEYISILSTHVDDIMQISNNES